MTEANKQEPNATKSNILIVDDEPSARDTLEALLYPEGYNLALAASGQEALEILPEANPDVILLDIMMPGMNGFEVCRFLKTSRRWRHVPVLLITALDTTEDLVRGFEAGANDFLHKPVNGLELQVRVRSMLQIKKQHDELQANLNLREDLSNMIVHDMKTPLSIIILYGTMLRDSLSEERDLKRIDKLIAAGRRLDSFSNDLLVVAKTQADRLVLNRSQVDVNQLVHKLEESHVDMANSRGIQLDLITPSTSRQLLMDENLFQRVLDNLLSNAIKFSPKQSRVALHVEFPNGADQQEPKVRIKVIDEGRGIPEKARERIFDTYEIIRMRERGVRQVGLGLAFCKMVMEAHGGRIYVNANQPKGSIFTVEL